MPKPDTSQPTHEKRTRQRAALSCTECRRRKQKCNQAKDRPCNHCARRYPPVECVYDSGVGSGSRSRESRSRERLNAPAEPFDVPIHARQSTTTPHQHTLTVPGHSHHHRPTPHSPLQQLTSTPSPSYVEEAPPPPAFNVPIRELSPASRERLQSHSGSTFDISSIFLIDRPRPESPYFSMFDASRYGVDIVPTPIGFGGSAREMIAGSLPVGARKRNGELLYFFIQRLSPYTSSIDGHNPSPSFTAQWMSFLIQSPLVVYLSILSAAYFQAMASGIEVEKSVDAIATRTTLIGLINEHLSSRGGVSDEAIAAVMSLSYNELIYSDRKSVLAHMNGLKSMIKSRGGIESIETPVLRILLARTDYQISLTYEIPPFLHGPHTSSSSNSPHSLPPLLKSYPLDLDSPLLNSTIRFSSPESLKALGIELKTGQLLDEMRFLTTSILSLYSSSHSSRERASTSQRKAERVAAKRKFLKTAKWLYDRLVSASSSSSSTSSSSSSRGKQNNDNSSSSSQPRRPTSTSSTSQSQQQPPPPSSSTSSPLHQTIHTASLILLTALTTHQPLSKSCTPQLLQRLWSTMWRVPLPRWKTIPGIFLWVLSIVAPSTREKREGRFVGGLWAAGFVDLGIRGWGASGNGEEDVNVGGGGADVGGGEERRGRVSGWEVVLGIVRSFEVVQSWLRDGDEGSSERNDFEDVDEHDEMKSEEEGEDENEDEEEEDAD